VVVVVLWFELPHRVAADGAQHTAPPPDSTKAPSVPHSLSLGTTRCRRRPLCRPTCSAYDWRCRASYAVLL